VIYRKVFLYQPVRVWMTLAHCKIF